MATKHSLFKEYSLKLSISDSKTAVILNKDIILNKKKYRISELDTEKDKLAAIKSKLDIEYKKPRFAAYWSNFDPFKYEKANIAQIGNTSNVSNAWVKCTELINAFDLANPLTNVRKKTFMHFDNAAFPGSFIVATHHLINTLYKKFAGKYLWRASSLLEANAQAAVPLEDKYGLYANFQDKWLMHKKNNGDVLNEANQIDFCDQLGNSVDLYTSDLGFDVSSDYNNQELMQLPANIGQILTGLLTLKKGGSLITKQYTAFEPTTISVMYAVSHFFDEFYLCKPYSSRMANSEMYLIGKGFHGGVYLTHPYIKALFDRISGRVPIDIPLFGYDDYPQEYLDIVIKSAVEMTALQSNKLDLDIKRTNQCLSNNYKGPPKDSPPVKEFYTSAESLIVEWYGLNPILPIERGKPLSNP